MVHSTCTLCMTMEHQQLRRWRVSRQAACCVRTAGRAWHASSSLFLRSNNATHGSPRLLVTGTATVCVSTSAMVLVAACWYGRQRTRDSAVNVLSWLA